MQAIAIQRPALLLHNELSKHENDEFNAGFTQHSIGPQYWKKAH